MSVKDASELLRPLLEGGRSSVAGRLAGALRRIGRADVADEILAAMKAADYDVRESDPFLPEQSFAEVQPHVAPLAGRIRGLWKAMRGTVIRQFPEAPGRPEDERAYLAFVDDVYQSDAWKSARYHFRWLVLSQYCADRGLLLLLDQVEEYRHRIQEGLRSRRHVPGPSEVDRVAAIPGKGCRRDHPRALFRGFSPSGSDGPWKPLSPDSTLSDGFLSPLRIPFRHPGQVTRL